MRVIGLGDNVVDKYIHIRTMYPGGNALNFSVYAKQLGADSAYLGVFGSDAAAKHIIDVLTGLGVDISRCRQFEGENGYAAVKIENGDRVFIESNSGGVLKKVGLELTSEDLDYLKGFDLVHTSCYSYMESQLGVLKNIGVPVSFDFSDDFDSSYLERVCPMVYFSFLSCSHLGKEEVLALLKKVYDLGSRIVVATLGPKGAILYDGNKFFYQEPKPVEAVDALGAGDSLITAFLLHYIENLEHINANIEEVIPMGLKNGAELASETCMIEGAFGHGLKY